jgi:hypothetical protein
MNVNYRQQSFWEKFGLGLSYDDIESGSFEDIEVQKGFHAIKDGWNSFG